MVFKAINFGQNDCGKNIQTSKKRFFWTFIINGEQHTLEVICSFLSGKKKVKLDSMQIYKQKKQIQILFNINFQFRHNIDNHSIRVTQDKMQLQCFIDNRSFQSWMRKTVRDEHQNKKEKVVVPKIRSNDPFSEFGKSSKKVDKQQNHNDDFQGFGQFNFNFSTSPSNNKPQPIIQQQPSQTPSSITNNQTSSVDFFDLMNQPNPQRQSINQQVITLPNNFNTNQQPKQFNFFDNTSYQNPIIETKKQNQFFTNNNNNYFFDFQQPQQPVNKQKEQFQLIDLL